MLAFIIAIAFHLINVSQEYMKFNVASTRHIMATPGLVFPAVTLCNMNPINPRKLKAQPELLRQLKKTDGVDLDDRQLPTTNGPGVVKSRRKRDRK